MSLLDSFQDGSLIPERLTTSEDAVDGVSFGIADFVAQEEMDR
jgi:hypothetical protein